MSYPPGRNNSITDVSGVRVAHLTLRTNAGGARPVRTGLTAIFTCPPDGRSARPAAVVTLGGRTEVTGLNFLDDFGFLTNPIVATSMRALGRVYDATLSRRTRVMSLGWPPIVVGFDDGRLSDQRRVSFTEEDITKALDEASDDKVPEGAVGAATGLTAFGYKSGVGSASRRLALGNESWVVGALVLLNLGRREALRLNGTAPKGERAPTIGPPPLRGSGLVVVATDAPLDDKQARRVAATSLQPLARLGVIAGLREGLVAYAVSTGVQLTRNDRNARQIVVPRSSDVTVAAVAEAAAEAAEEAGRRTLTTVARADGTAEYPVMPAPARRSTPGRPR